jgi:hypothetical protein
VSIEDKPFEISLLPLQPELKEGAEPRWQLYPKMPDWQVKLLRMFEENSFLHPKTQ